MITNKQTMNYTETITEVNTYNNLNKGDEFKITHVDGFIANEKIAYIVLEWADKVVHGPNYIQKKVVAARVVCESAAVYDLEDVKI